jgi:hypothetical protein
MSCLRTTLPNPRPIESGVGFSTERMSEVPVWLIRFAVITILFDQRPGWKPQTSVASTLQISRVGCAPKLRWTENCNYIYTRLYDPAVSHWQQRNFVAGFKETIHGQGLMFAHDSSSELSVVPESDSSFDLSLKKHFGVLLLVVAVESLEDFSGSLEVRFTVSTPWF